MPHTDRFERSYLIVDTAGDASASNVAALLEQATQRLRRHGDIVVHHMVFETDSDASNPRMCLTLYYDRIGERRRP